jgi:apolipoprotein D and lipocalin family protein
LEISQGRQNEKNMTDKVLGRPTNWRQYLGRWWEQARVPSWFEPPNARLAVADYALLPDGSIRVINAYTDRFGRRHQAVGRARIDPRRPGTLRVSFFPPFESDYVVLAHGCAHPNAYDCAVVGSRNRRRLWFLTRNQHATPQQMQIMARQASLAGYRPTLNRLQITPK